MCLLPIDSLFLDLHIGKRVLGPRGFDPFSLPSAFATREGTAQASQLLERHLEEGGQFPESVALVLWGSDNIKTDGGPIGQALALIGAKPRFDSFGRLSGADLVPLRCQGHAPKYVVNIPKNAIMMAQGIILHKQTGTTPTKG